MAASGTAGARTERRHLRLSGATKLGVRIVVSAALLALLITKIPADDVQPKDTHFGTMAFLAAGLAFTLAGFVLSAWRWQRVFAVFDVHVGIGRIRHEPRQAVRVLVAAIAYQVSVLLAVYCAIHALGISVPNGAVLAFLLAVASAQVLPISVSGLGIREGLLVLLLRPL